MYTRSYFNETDQAPRPPENYDGNAFKEEAPRQTEEKTEGKTAEVNAGAQVSENSKARGASPLGGLFTAGISSLFGGRGIPILSSLSLPKIGTEEIILIAAAAYLFFSKDGDRECAILLLLLLFVN